MKAMRGFLAVSMALLCLPAFADEPAGDTVLAIHGGAGVIRKGMTPESEKQVRAALALALRKGHEQLAAGKPALDAVTAAITVLEDDPHFNAGKGAVFTHEGRNELDASLMDGATLKAGAVAGVRRVKNPILLARAVMEHSPHVMLTGEGAEAFAKARGWNWSIRAISAPRSAGGSCRRPSRKSRPGRPIQIRTPRNISEPSAPSPATPRAAWPRERPPAG